MCAIDSRLCQAAVDAALGITPPIAPFSQVADATAGRSRSSSPPLLV